MPVDALAIRAVDHRLGAVCVFETYCTACGAVINTTFSSDRMDGSKSSRVPFVVTRRLVAASMDMGVGHSGIRKLCRFLNMPCLHHSSFTVHARAIVDACKRVVSEVLSNAACVARRAYRDLDHTIRGDNVIDVTVSFDGSWMTRGHSSLYGIGCVVGVVTGLVLDYAVMSRYCQQCANACVRYGGKATVDFTEWYRFHERDCNINYSGSAGGMEVRAAELLWERSVQRGFRYTTLLSDGDARTFKHLCDLRVYGDVELEKEECVNHVAKRLGTALRKLATQGKKAGVTLGGHGRGKLTQRVITQLTQYYGNAVRAHSGDLDGMRDAILATFFHAISTNEAPQHQHCPIGLDSWCFYQRALAADNPTAELDHEALVGTPLSAEVGEQVKDVYLRLSHDDLLKRCLRGGTQNANESLHSKVWAKCPKTGFVSLNRVMAATCSAISEFNSGVEVTMTRLCRAMRIVPGCHLLASAEKADCQRVSKSRFREAAATKAARRARRLDRLRNADSATAATADYAAGQF